MRVYCRVTRHVRFCAVLLQWMETLNVRTEGANRNLRNLEVYRPVCHDEIVLSRYCFSRSFTFSLCASAATCTNNNRSACEETYPSDECSAQKKNGFQSRLYADTKSERLPRTLNARSIPYPQAECTLHPARTHFISTNHLRAPSAKMAAALCNHLLTAGLAGRCARPAKSRRSLQVSATQTGPAQVWLPGVERPNHLEGKDIPGNRGFDPLGLGRDEDRLKW